MFFFLQGERGEIGPVGPQGIQVSNSECITRKAQSATLHSKMGADFKAA